MSFTLTNDRGVPRFGVKAGFQSPAMQGIAACLYSVSGDGQVGHTDLTLAELRETIQVMTEIADNYEATHEC